LNTPFQITYGSGAANGTLAQDTASMAGYTVESQTFALVTQASDDLLTYPYSGLMGLAWARLASSRSTPFWQQLAQTGQLATPAMGFYLARYRGNQYATRVEQDGGLMTLGYLNQTLYEGNITYVSIADDEKDYWRIPIGGIRIGDTAIGIVSQQTGLQSILHYFLKLTFRRRWIWGVRRLNPMEMLLALRLTPVLP
jgi:hypothetical protein